MSRIKHLDNGTNVRLETRTGTEATTVVVVDHPDAPDDMRNYEVGRLFPGLGFLPAPFCEAGLRPAALRAIADLIEENT